VGRVERFGVTGEGAQLDPALVLLVVIALVSLLIPVGVIVGAAVRTGGEDRDRRLAATLGEFHRAHPGIEITLGERHNEPLLEALAGGELDAAVIGLPDEPLPPQLRARVIAEDAVVLAVPREHPLSRSRRIAIAALHGQPMITLTRGTGLRATLEGACRDAGFAPRIIAETSQLGHMVELVAAGLGIAVMPGSALAGAELAVLRITRPRLLRRTALAWNQVTTTPAGRAFLALAEARLRLDDGE